MSASGEWPRNISRMAPLVSPESSFTSSSSFGDKVSQPQSPPGLRRSTFDLGHLKSSAVMAVSEPNLQDSSKIQQEVARTYAVSSHGSDAAAMGYLAVLQAIVFAESGIRGLISEARHHVSNVFGFLFHTIFPSNSDASMIWDDPCIPGSSRKTYSPDSRERLNEPPPDPLLSPARVTAAANSNPRDEWGHFADFQDEIADERSFIPSYAPLHSSLETLEESDGDEDDEHDEDAISF